MDGSAVGRGRHGGKERPFFIAGFDETDVRRTSTGAHGPSKFIVLIHSVRDRRVDSSMGWEELKGEDENEHATEENVSLPSTHRIISLFSCSSCCSGTGTNPIFVADRLQDSYTGATHSAVRFESVWAAQLQQMGGMEVRGVTGKGAVGWEGAALITGLCS